MRAMRRLAALAAVLCVAWLAAATAAPAAAHHVDCKAGYYENSSGHCVRRPAHAPTVPKGATAKCRDGTYSFSEHARGTCSHHGGVAVWIHHPSS
jgi:hypothetical protein